jgi:pyrroloquinoline-quinone synthase
VSAHPAVTHPFLARFAAGGLTRWQVWGSASQHYHLVCFFAAYLEAIAGRTPDDAVPRLLREILEDEYMRPQSFERSHPALYRRLLRAVGFGEGDWDHVPLLPATRAFVQHMTARSSPQAEPVVSRLLSPCPPPPVVGLRDKRSLPR